MQRKHTNIFVPAKGNNEPVEMVSSFEYLGILVDNKLRFSDNIYIYILITETLVFLALAEMFLMLVMSC